MLHIVTLVCPHYSDVICRGLFVYAASKWEMTLQCKSSLIGWARRQSDPCIWASFSLKSMAIFFYFFRQRAHKMLKSGLLAVCEGKLQFTSGFPSQMASNKYCVSMAWRRLESPFLYNTCQSIILFSFVSLCLYCTCELMYFIYVYSSGLLLWRWINCMITPGPMMVSLASIH